jgi:hypothetical protein
MLVLSLFKGTIAGCSSSFKARRFDKLISGLQQRRREKEEGKEGEKGVLTRRPTQMGKTPSRDESTVEDAKKKRGRPTSIASEG